MTPLLLANIFLSRVIVAYVKTSAVRPPVHGMLQLWIRLPSEMNLKNSRDDVRIMTLQAHILGEQAKHPHASGTFSWILSALSISAKIIADKVRRARLENVLGSVGVENVQGEVQQKLDVLANDRLFGALGGREGVALVASQENKAPG